MSATIFRAFIASLLAIIVIGLIIFGIFFYINNDGTSGEGRSIDDINDLSYETAEITTDLKDGRFVRIQFRVITDNKKAMKELEKRDFQIKNIIIKELSLMEEESFSTGLLEVETTLRDKLNEVMTEGKITDVYTISKILQ